MNTIKLKKLWNRMCDSLKVEINEDNSIIKGFENNISHVKNVMKASDFIWYKKAVKNHEKRQLDFRNTLARQAYEEDENYEHYKKS